MTETPAQPDPLPAPEAHTPSAWAVGPPRYAPFLRAPEASRSIFLVIFAAACVPLAAGVFFFGWRALIVTALSVGGCMFMESAYYRVTRTPALLGRTHAAVTGLLLGLTLPPFAPWYVPLAGAAFAIIVGKALFGGVGHFLWQPALVGRLAVAVIFAPPLLPTNLLDPPQWPVLAESRAVMGDVTSAKGMEFYHQWQGTPPPAGADAILQPRPVNTLRQLTLPEDAPAESLSTVLRRCPRIGDLILGAYGGGIGETCTVAIIVAGLYLVYRNYVRGYLPGLFILSAAAAAAIAPIQTAGAEQWQWLPLRGAGEGFDAGFTYVCYQLACGDLMLAAWFLATEMTSRPVTAPAQAIYGILCGAGAMLLRLYLPISIPAYAAVLLGNTLTPFLDASIRPRPFGRRRWWQRRRMA